MWRKFADHEGTGEGSLQAEGSFLYISRLQSVVGVDSKRKYHFTQHDGKCRGKEIGTGLCSYYPKAWN